LPESSEIVKLEIYDIENKMMFCAICLECIHLQNAGRENQRSARAKRDKEEEKTYFAGFSIVHTERMQNGGIRTSYSDGLNRFSIFRTPIGAQKDSEPEKFIVYGNYVYNKDLGGFRYTVVGSVPFDKMVSMISAMGESE
jgi:negative regulator of sigma E activity